MHFFARMFRAIGVVIPILGITSFARSVLSTPPAPES